jgi:GGDEF domain-containing protein
MFNQRTLLLLLPALVAGTAAVAAASAVDALALRIGLQAVAVAAFLAMACYVGISTPREIAEAEIVGISAAQTKALQADRRKPTFDRDTGLYANWYFRLRVEEEIARASRYGQPFTMLRIAASTPDGLNAPRLALKGWLREVDFAGDLGDMLAVLLPNTTRDGAAIVMGRLEGLVPDLQMHFAEYPVDGATLDQLLGDADWRVTDGQAAA